MAGGDSSVGVRLFGHVPAVRASVAPWVAFRKTVSSCGDLAPCSAAVSSKITVARTSLRFERQGTRISDHSIDISYGERAEEIHSAFNLSADDAKNLDKVIEAFDNHFIGKRNVVSQRPEETTEEFVTVLHRISEHCEYANLRDELIRDRIVLGVKDRKLSEKLMLNENLNLAKAVEIARQWEAVMREQQDLNPSTSQVDKTRKLAKQKPKASGHGKDNGRSTSRQTDSAKEIDEGKKYQLALTVELPNIIICPAKDKVCGKCAKKGHYTNLCRRKNNEVNAISSEETPAREKASFVYAVREPTLGNRKSRWKSTVRINGQNTTWWHREEPE
ncbi:hypothetical protein LAZ67_15002011 [Cordylochernes scorpioides]|uniref:Gag protein n=1 Tax=Cordylochernes scorpioides TaxID=51811 RepID=A0ABY6L9J4_9ARAC|nr:hypothetical protein LAZ67_15002011 [Cordylochernes scorpioides]